MFGKRSALSEISAPAPQTKPAPVAPAPVAIEPPPPPSGAVMETGRTPFPSDGLGAPLVGTPANRSAAPPSAPSSIDNRRSETYYETKGTIFGALIEAIDLAQLARLDADSAREEIRDIVNEIIAIKSIQNKLHHRFVIPYTGEL